MSSFSRYQVCTEMLSHCNSRHSYMWLKAEAFEKKIKITLCKDKDSFSWSSAVFTNMWEAKEKTSAFSSWKEDMQASSTWLNRWMLPPAMKEPKPIWKLWIWNWHQSHFPFLPTNVGRTRGDLCKKWVPMHNFIMCECISGLVQLGSNSTVCAYHFKRKKQNNTYGATDYINCRITFPLESNK